MTFSQEKFVSNTEDRLEKKSTAVDTPESTAKIIDLARVRAALAERKLSVPEELSVDSEKIRDLERDAQKLQRALEDITADQKTLSKEPGYFKNGPAAKSESGRKIQQAMKEKPSFDPKKGVETMSTDATRVQEELRLKKSEADYIKSQSKPSEALAVDQRLAA